MSVFQSFLAGRRSTKLQCEVAACLPIFERLANQLTAIASEVETKVVDTCSSLGSVANRTKMVVESASTCLDGEEGGMSGAELTATTRTALTSLLTVTDCLGDVARIAESVRLVALNGRIEAARAGKHGDAFSVVATETTSLADKAMETSETVHDTVEKLENLLKSKNEDEFSPRSARCSDLIARLLVQLDSHNTIVANSMADLAKTNGEISQEVSKAIVGLQFQDSVNQRLEHVVSSIREICEVLKPLTSDASAEQVENRTNEWNERMQSHFTMAAEHAAADNQDVEQPMANIELF